MDKDWRRMAEVKESKKEGRTGRASQRDPPSAASGEARQRLPGEPLLCQDSGHGQPLQISEVLPKGEGLHGEQATEAQRMRPSWRATI